MVNQTKPFVVVATKSSGVRVVFSRYSTRKDAERAGATLRSFGMSAIVEAARFEDEPGTTRPAQSDMNIY